MKKYIQRAMIINSSSGKEVRMDAIIFRLVVLKCSTCGTHFHNVSCVSFIFNADICAAFTRS